jgi:uncharacterized protein (DUF1800 family)
VLIEDDPREKRGALIGTWYLRLLTTKRPLLERMTYFWHDHFATAIHKVGNPGLMQVQNETLRRCAFGDFGELLAAVTRDPAMMVWLDNRTNVRGAPNENYARELLKLHTLGVTGNLDAHGMGDEVTTMAWTEFGRRVG